jgi:predicted HicB family RNase H-like nuclease
MRTRSAAEPFIQISVRLAPNVAKHIAAAAAGSGKSQSKLIADVLSDWAFGKKERRESI